MKHLLLIAFALCLTACDTRPPDSNKIQADQQERILKESTSALGMPAIRHFREKRTLKMIYELLDQDGLSTYTYIIPAQTGKPVLLCNSVGYAISYATGYTNPDKLVDDERYGGRGLITMTQAEPNGLFTPDVSDANWVMCIDPTTSKPTPIYISAPIVVLTYKLP